jgi:hypothetical protein
MKSKLNGVVREILAGFLSATVFLGMLGLLHWIIDRNYPHSDSDKAHTLMLVGKP